MSLCYVLQVYIQMSVKVKQDIKEAKAAAAKVAKAAAGPCVG